MSTLHKRFGGAVRRLRLSTGLSQEGFADRVGVHRTFIGTVERGETNISLDNIERIAKTLGITLARLFAEVEQNYDASDLSASKRAQKAFHRR